MPRYRAPRYARYRPPRRIRARRRRISSGRISGKEIAAMVAAGVTFAALVSGRASTSHAAGHPPAAVVADAARPGSVAAREAAKAVAFAYAQLGKPYVWGGTGPPQYDGFDCSGLTWSAWRSAGVILPRVSEDQFGEGHKVTAGQLVPGDLVYSYWAVDDQASPNHVQMYVGGGYVIGADTTDVEKVPLSGDAGHIVGYTNPAAGS
jgi:cell wall-associated NlpC family hydrolase